MAMAKAKAKFAAPPGAGKVDDGSGALLRSSGSATLSDRLVGLLDAPPPRGRHVRRRPWGRQGRRPPWGRQRRRRIRRLLHLRTTVRTSWHLRVIARRSERILMNAARECRANICYYVAHVDYIQYIGGLKPIGEGVIFVISTATTAAGELRACATIAGMGIIYIPTLGPQPAWHDCYAH
jgi:hypothetical protein